MCLAIPGKIESINPEGELGPMGQVNFGGVLKEICLAYVPEAVIGQYVVVHAGFALSVVDEAEANQVFEYLRQMNELADLQEQSPPKT